MSTHRPAGSAPHTVRPLLAAALATLCVAGPARAEEPAPQRLEVHADLQNLMLMRNDSDFDRSEPLYNASGRSVGAMATVFRPDFTWHLEPNLRLFYQAEIGLNYWGKQNPDQENSAARDAFVMKHRELYGEGSFDGGRYGFKVGYSRFQDASGLFVNHWIGVAQARYAWSDRGGAELFFGQIPDQVFEGIDVTQNNFRRDIFVFGASTKLKLSDALTLNAGLHNLHDEHAVGQTRWAVVPNVQLQGRFGPLDAVLEAALQLGNQQGLALGGGDQAIVAWALQARAAYELPAVKLEWNLLALSPDDDHAGNDREGAFLYAGKSRSATLMLTEDETRDWYDNVDERLGSYRDGFFANPAGLLVTDVKATWKATEAFQPALVVGVASALNPTNALGNAFVGLETDLVLDYRLSEHLAFQLAGGALVPGAAAAVVLNGIDRERTDPVFMFEGSLRLKY